jgi:K(+)-stimulated pyrophosphate-energized sodium pump
MPKRHKFKSIKYRKLGVYWTYSNRLLFLSTIHASSNYEDGIFGEGSQDISSMSILCNLGLFVGGAISSVTEYYTGLGTKPVMAIVQKSTGAGTNVAGLATGMISTFPTVLLFAAAIWSTYALAGFMV